MSRDRTAGDEADRWLDGLAGREGDADCPAHAEGRALRAALHPAADAEPAAAPGWQAVRAAAGQLDHHDAVAATEAPAAANDADRSRPSAPGPRWRIDPGALRLAAGVLLAVAAGLTLWQRPTPDHGEVQWRGLAPAPLAAPVWYSPTPADDAARLADELRALGAEVRLQASDDRRQATLEVTAAGPRIDEVAALLASVKVGLDARGQARVQVRSLPAS